MNKETIYQLLKDNAITAEDALKYIQSINEDVANITMDAGGWYIGQDVGYDNDVQYDEDDSYEEPTFTQLVDNDRVLRKEVKKVLDLWTGLYKTEFKALTPDILTELNDRCNQIQAYAALRDRLIINCADLGYTQKELSEYAHVYGRSEQALVYCITQSWCLSNGQDIETKQHKATVDGFNQLRLCNDFDCDMLQIVQVTPWEMPPCPPLSIPERPAVVLDVMRVGEGHVSAGWDDVFNPIVMVEYLPVDEELCVGDKIIVKGSKWNPKTSLIQEPEYDGIAEQDCPVSTEEELLELKYTFNPEKEQAKLLERHKKAWMRQHWKLLTEAQILKIAGGASVEDVIERIEFDENLQLLQEMKKLINWSTQYENDYYTYNKYQTYDNYNEVSEYTNRQIVNKIISGMDPILKLKVT